MTSAPYAPKDGGGWWWLLIAGLSIAFLYVLIPYGAVASGVYVLATAAAALAILLGIKQQPNLICPTAWLFIAIALGLAATGHGIWYWLDLYGYEPFPSPADIFYLLVYPLFIVALWQLGKQSAPDDGALSDALIVGVAAMVLGWAVLIAPYLEDPELSTLQLLVSTAYPVADLILLPLILRLIFLHRAQITAHLLLLLGMLAYLVADMLYAHGNATGWYAPGGMVDGFWLISYALIMAAVWHPSAQQEPRALASAREMSGRRLLVLGTASMLAPAVILLTAGVDVETVRVAAIGSIILFLLVMHRMAGLVRKTHQQAEQLEKLSRLDPLTGAANRRQLHLVLNQEISRAHQANTPLAVAFLDLDHFKQFNDTHGHAAGDDLLKALVRAWRPLIRPTDLLARNGGEEFVVVLPHTDIKRARKLVEQMLKATPKGQTCSAGIAILTSEDSADSLIARADHAMYTAKNAGRDQVILADASG